MFRLNFKFNSLPFRQQLMLITVFGVLVISVLAALGDWWQSSRQVQQMLIDQGRQVAESLARQSKLAILTEAPDNATDAVDAALAFPDIEHVEVRQVHGKLITSRSKGKRAIADAGPISYAGLRETHLESETDDAWVFVAPVLSKGAADSPFEMAPAGTETLGYVRIVQSKATMRQIMFDILIVNQGIALFFFVLFFFIVQFLTNRVTQPLTQLSEIMARAERGEADVHADISGPKDIEDMAHAFNSMMKVLQEREADLRKARDEALKFARLKAEFAATVSHEIRTPLNGVIGTLDMLMASNLPPRQRQFVEIAWDSAQYLLDLINNILDFSKLEAGKLMLEHAEFEVRHLAEGVVDLFGQQAHQKGLDIGYLAEADVPQRVKGDARRIRQVLINLVGNAVKFTDRGEVAVRIQFREGALGETHVRFEVHDTGIGVTDELRGEIFESFTQGDATATRRYSGSGLGLAISKQLVGLMGGELGVDSTAGVSSCFWFDLPVTVVPAMTALESAQRGLKTDARILIVEDSTVVRNFLEQSLTGSGFSCRSLPGANEALMAMRDAVAHGTPFDVVIMDIGFVSAAGGELVAQIRGELRLAATRVIVMNRYGADTLPATTQADAYLTKPLRLDRVLECITSLLGESPRTAAETQAQPAADPETKSRRVLVVEDNRTNQAVAQAMLGMLGCQAEIAVDGHDALRAFKHRNWDMILMDCNMPDVDGYQVTMAIRAQEQKTGARTPIVAMTANTLPSDVDKCLAAGMDDHLAKPLTLGSLAAKIKRWIPGHALEMPHDARLAPDTSMNLAKSTGPLDPVVFGKLREALDDLIGQTIQLFLEDMPGYVTEMKTALRKGEPEQLRRAAHAIKGASGNIGAAGLAALAKSIEEKAETGVLAGTEELLENMRAEYTLVKQALTAELSTEIARPLEHTADGALVLVVDDDRSTRAALRYALQRSGFRVEEAADGAQALALVDRIRPSAILMDGLMPVMDGFTACAKLQEMPEGKDIPVLMITALEDTASIERAFAAGASDYISKPIHLAVVNQRIKRVIEATQAERHVRHLAYNDVLTGLPNRVLLNDYLNEAIVRANTRNQALAVLFLDLDRFKFVNDTLGHETGDHLLKSVARRIKHCVRTNDVVARLGGDEFTVILDDLPTTSAASNAAQKICRALAASFEIEGHDIFVSASIGISIYPNDGTDTSTLLRHADTAMYRAKKNNAGFQFYEPGMETTVSEHLRMENALRHALDRNELVLHFQPIAKTRSGKVTAAEALLRWQHPARGLIPPADFIPIAEETGMIVPIGEWVLRTACEQAQRWHSAGIPNLRLTVNLSGNQLKQEEFAHTVQDILRETGFDPNYLTLEITESVLMGHAHETVDVLNELRAIGLHLAIDDFGTGYSSLAYLRRFPVNTLKIDRAFISDVTTSADDAAIVTGIIALAHSLRLQVVAEGVETREQCDFLAKLECDYIQGYFLDQPLPAEAFERRILATHFPNSNFVKRLRPV